MPQKPKTATGEAWQAIDRCGGAFGAPQRLLVSWGGV